MGPNTRLRWGLAVALGLSGLCACSSDSGDGSTGSGGSAGTGAVAGSGGSAAGSGGSVAGSGGSAAGSGGAAGADAGSDAGDVCVACGSLQSACPTGLGCPPDLGAAGFDAWVQSAVAEPTVGWAACSSISGCPELVMLTLVEGVDCGTEYLFDATTKKLVGITHSCAGYGIVLCKGAEGCLPERCMPSLGNVGPSSACGLPDAG